MATKRLNGEGSIRKRKNGSWEARITVGIDAETSRQIRKSFYGKTRGEVKVKLEAFLDQQDDNQVPPEPTPPRSIPEGFFYFFLCFPASRKRFDTQRMAGYLGK